MNFRCEIFDGNNGGGVMYARGGGGGEGDVFLESNTEGIIEEEVDGQYCNLLEHTRCPPTVIISSFIVFVVVVVLFILYFVYCHV